MIPTPGLPLGTASKAVVFITSYLLMFAVPDPDHDFLRVNIFLFGFVCLIWFCFLVNEYLLALYDGLLETRT